MKFLLISSVSFVFLVFNEMRSHGRLLNELMSRLSSRGSTTTSIQQGRALRTDNSVDINDLINSFLQENPGILPTPSPTDQAPSLSLSSVTIMGSPSVTIMSEGMTAASSQNSSAPTKMPQKANQSWTSPLDLSLPTTTSVGEVTGDSAQKQDPQASASDSSPAPQVFQDNSANLSPTPNMNQAPQALPSSAAQAPPIPQSGVNEISQMPQHSSTTLPPTSASPPPQASQGSPASLAPKPVPIMTQSPTVAFSSSATPTLKPPFGAAGSNSMSTLGSAPTLKIESSPTKPSGVLDTGLSPNSPISRTRAPLIVSRAPLISVSPPTKGPSLPQPETTKAPVVVPPTQSTTPPNSFASRPSKPKISLNNNVVPRPTLPPVGELQGAPLSFIIKPVNPLQGTASPSPSPMGSYPTSPTNWTMPSANAPNLPFSNSSSVAPTPTPSPTRSAANATMSPKPYSTHPAPYSNATSTPTRVELNRKRLSNKNNEHGTSIESSLKISYSRNYAQQQHPMPESPSWLAAHGFIVLGACFVLACSICFVLRRRRGQWLALQWQ